MPDCVCESLHVCFAVHVSGSLWVCLAVSEILWVCLAVYVGFCRCAWLCL